jgi:hypothetical protein
VQSRPGGAALVITARVAAGDSSESVAVGAESLRQLSAAAHNLGLEHLGRLALTGRWPA